MAIELSKPEKELLAAILEKELEDVRSELHHTQDHEYKGKGQGAGKGRPRSPGPS